RAVLERVKYGKLADHEREHRRIEKELNKVLATIGVAQPSRAEVEAVLYLRSLLVHHFFRFDIAYKAHLLGAPGQGSRSRRTQGTSVEPEVGGVHLRQPQAKGEVALSGGKQ